MNLPETTVRAMVESDRGWVIDSWVRSYRDHGSSRMSHRMPGQEYAPRWRKLVAALLERSNVLVLVPDFDPDTIIGWACIEGGNRLHYCHTKPQFQRLGVQRALLDAGIKGGPVLYSHRTTCWDKIHLSDDWAFAPWLLIGV